MEQNGTVPSRHLTAGMASRATLAGHRVTECRSRLGLVGGQRQEREQRRVRGKADTSLERSGAGEALHTPSICDCLHPVHRTTEELPSVCKLMPLVDPA
mmetsp:Transcript_97980/g.168884  ORF Transcript_97980/g.168884 Transcript_97980/m.168884 type:complete len:99 (+) Transcript_97980:46-342(+)